MDKVTHFHLPANDIGRAKKFYQEIFGWEIIDAGMEKAMVGGKVNYHLANTVDTDKYGLALEPGAINGALFLRDSPEESQLIVINVPSIDEYLKKVEASGGRVVMPKSPVGDFGMYAEIADTESNVVGLFQDL